MSRGRVHLGDLLRAARALHVADVDELRSLAGAMGLGPPYAARETGEPWGTGETAGRAAGRPAGPGTRRTVGRGTARRDPGRTAGPDGADRHAAGPVPARPLPGRAAVPSPARPPAPHTGPPAHTTDPALSADPALAADDEAPLVGGSLLTLRPARPHSGPGGGTAGGHGPQSGRGEEAPLAGLAGFSGSTGPAGSVESTGSVELFEVPWPLRPPEPASPWNPATERAILLAVSGLDVAGRTVDHARLLKMVMRHHAGGPPTRTRVPYRHRTTTRAGLHLLLDRGESMRPFGPDHAWIAGLAARLLPPGQLRIMDFRITRGASEDGGRTWGPHPVPPHGRPVILLSDLGHLQPPLPGRHRSSPPDWVPYLRRLRRAGSRVIVLTPYRPEDYPAAVRQLVTLLPLDRRTSVRTARSATRRDRNRRRGRVT